MRATQIEIRNFRSIKRVRIDLLNVSLLAGANNAGKSNIVDAIRMFYGDIKWTDERDQPKFDITEDESWVEIEFLPSKEENQHLSEKYKSKTGTFRVRNYVKPSKDKDGKVRSGYYAFIDDKISETLFYGAKNVASGKFGKIVYIPAVSRIDDHTKLTGPSALRDLVATVLDKVIVGSHHYTALAAAFSSFEGGVKSEQTEEGRSLIDLEDEIGNELKSWNIKFNLDIQNVQPDDLIKSLVKPVFIDEFHGSEVDQSRFGAGFQRNLIFTLIRLAGKYSSKVARPNVDKKEFSPQLTWILFEEPEAFLHPSQEDVLFDSLLLLAEDQSSQVLMTTHSARFVSRSLDDLTRLVRLRRDAAITSTYQLSQEQLDAFFDAARADDEEINPENGETDRLAAMSALKMELWLHPQRAASFFSKNTILVEGQSEISVHTYLARNGYLVDRGQGVVVVDCMGKWNLHRFMKLMNAFGIDHSVLYDSDKNSAKDARVDETVNLSRGMFTKKVHKFESDLEDVLGVPPASQKQRKPQHLLYHLKADLIDESKVNELGQLFDYLASATSSEEATK